jgi:shikimate dehydrogenase
MIDLRGTTRLVGLLGWPTSHSLSPPMQNAGFATLELDWAYVPLPTRPELLADAVRGLVAMGFAGANVTIPHKQAVIPLCDTLDEVAERAGSVNTVVIQDGRVHGVSTDGAAVTDQVAAGGRQALVLGAGGAAKAVIDALRAVGCDVRVASRRDPVWPPSADGVELLVNCTPVKEELIVAPSAEMQVVDLAYFTDGRDTALVAAAKAAGCKVVVDGLEVLLAQGAASFTLWTGRPAPLDAMRAAVHNP